MSARITAFSLLVFACAAAGAAEPADIQSAGCVAPGVEAGCLVVNGFKDKKLYNILVQNNPPKVGDAISFKGKVHSGVTTCQQGTPVDVSTWKLLKMHCPVAKPAADAASSDAAAAPDAATSKAAAASKGATIVKDSVKAWINRMPGSEPKLIVTGEVQVTSTGWKVSLMRVEPQGINPAAILLKLEAVPPSGAAGQVMLKIPVRYEESPPHGNYTDATIVNGEESVSVKVTQAS